MLTTRFDDALAFASRAHRGQLRNGTAIPYVAHLLGVAAIALELGADEEQAIAALLHDAVEDQGGAAMLAAIRARFGARVARIVDDCTDSLATPSPPWRARKESYLQSLTQKPVESLLVSLADKTHNTRAIVDDLHAEGTGVWRRFNAGRDGQLWYYAELADIFAQLLPKHPGTARFRAIVGQMIADSGRRN